MLTLKRAHMLLLLLLKLLLSNASRVGELNSFCALTPYDIKTDTLGANNITHLLRTIPRFYRTKIAPPPRAGDKVRSLNSNSDRGWIPGPYDGNWKSVRGIKLMRLRRDHLPVRLRILYDDAFEEEHHGDELNMFIRNIILDLQMRYEEPIMLNAVKFNFVVTKLEKLKHQWPPAAAVEDMFATLNELEGSARGKDYDITFVLIYGHMNGIGNVTVYGAAPVGTFCNVEEGEQIVVVNAHTINIGHTLAHEFGHSLNVLHDGAHEFFEQGCDSESNMMSPYSGAGDTNWSNCSVEALTYYLSDDVIYKCVTDPQRIANSKPLSPMFDFGTNSSARLPLPGEQISLDRQCQLGFDKSVKSAGAGFSLSSNITTCDMVYCLIDREVIQLRPALPGSECVTVDQNYKLKEGVCKYGRCVI